MEMHSTKSRRGLLAAAGAVAAGVLIGGAAWACTPQAGLRGNVTSGAPGSTITLTGSTFDAAGSPVTLYWDGVRGTQIGTATVTAARTFSAQITVPENATAGTHIVSATQKDALGQPIAGSPVNMTFRVDGGTVAPAPTPNVQGQPEEAQGAVGLAPAPAPQAAPAPAPAPVAAPVPVVVRPRVTAPAATPAPAAAAAPAVAPAPVAAPAPAPEVVTPAPAVVAPAIEDATPAPEAAPATPTANEDSGSSGWVLSGLALLAVGLFAVGTGIFLSERKKTRAKA